MYQNNQNIINLNDKSVMYTGYQVTNGTSQIDIFYRFEVPPTARFLSLMCVGSGGAGGGGGASAAATIAGGGGGGGAGSSSSMLIPAFYLPKWLYLYPASAATGGSGQVQGGSASTAGGNGGSSFITIKEVADPATNTAAVLLCGRGGTGGVAGSGSTAGTGGAGGAAITFSNAPFSELGLTETVAGQSGTVGGTTGNGGTIIYSLDSTVRHTTGGTGGGGVNAGTTTTTGGPLTGAGIVPNISGGATAGGAGVNGHSFLLPKEFFRFSTGGTGGGGATSAGTGGAGGHGGLGSGGAGGGGANGTSSRGGAGGNSGPGYIIITVIN